MLRFLFLFCLSLLSFAPYAAAKEQPVYVLTLNGVIGPAYADYFKRGLNHANKDNAQLVILELNTPGGLLTTTREMVSDIIQSPVPVAIYVTPSGSHAASAGTFLLYAAHIAAMDEGTNVGAATPIQMGGDPLPRLPDQKKAKPERNKENNDTNLHRKAIEDTSAFIRGIAELRGRNADWAEDAVTQAKSITAKEALQKNVIDFIATNRTDLLKQIDGKNITLKNKETIHLSVHDAEIVVYAPDIRTQFMAIITDPNIAFILMTIGIYGLILEFYNPGSFIPGVIGAICLIIALFSMNVLAINSTGLILIVLGIAFMTGEVFMPSFGILGIGGILAFVFGAGILFDGESMPGIGIDWKVIGTMALIGVLLITVALTFLTKLLKKQLTTGIESMVAQPAEIIEWNQTKGRVRVQGEIWKAFSDKSLPYKHGDKATVAAVRDLSVKII